MHTEAHEVLDEHDDELPCDLSEFAAYDDGDYFVVCDRSNPNAWIRSDKPTDRSP